MKHGPNDVTLWQVYSLKSNYWRDLQVEMPNHSRYDGWQDTGYAVHLHGMCHWWGYEDYFGEQMLVSFNLSDDDFVKTPFPLSQNNVKFPKHFVVLKESIAMIEYGHPICFFISILGEFGVAESWTRLFSMVEPIGFGKNGDIFYIKWKRRSGKV
nr:Cyclin-like F-box; F-box protein interaction domain; Galactose oxidase, central, related [Medicago truncatula]